MGEYLRWDASAAAIFARIHRLVHGAEAPVPATISVLTIYTIPRQHGEQHILRFFTDSGQFGEGFKRMREAMAKSIEAFQQERDWRPPRIDGELGLTAQFLSLVAPGQAILVGTTSYRLDRLARYLSADGPRWYFNEGLQLNYNDLDAKRFLDEILDEVLGVYVPPRSNYRDPDQYLHDAFSVPENRTRANRNYLQAMQQIGLVWGTLLALKGFTRGESFVARNVGLKSVWEGGEWKAKIIFMDHDDLTIAGKNAKEFYPRGAYQAIADDEIHIFGGMSCDERIKGGVEFLQDIYRISGQVREDGAMALRKALQHAYKLTQQQLLNNPKLRAYFHESYLDKLFEWDAIVARYLKANGDPAAVEVWKKETEIFLTSKGYTKPMIYDCLCAVDSFDDLLSKYSLLY
jgi:hypothetical protein